MFGNGSQTKATDTGSPLGWIDTSHLVVSSNTTASVWILNVDK